jgi:hypothetical protein
MSIALSSDDRSVIDRKLIDESVSPKIESEDFEQVFEVDRCVEWIRCNDLQNVTLQFPDELLPFSAKVALAIESKVGNRYNDGYYYKM